MRKHSVRLTVAVAIIAMGVGGLAASGSSQTPTDVITANRFSITIDGVEIATFAELTGIVTEAEASGKLKPPTVTLKRGMTGNRELWSWHEAVRLGNLGAARRSASLTMFNSVGQPVAKFWLEKAWPSKIDLAGVKAGASEALIETVTLTTEYIQRIAP